MPGSSMRVLLGISNSIWVWCLQMGWIPRWGGLCFSFVPVFPLDRDNSGLKFLRWVGGPIPQLEAHAYPLDMVSTGSISSLLGITTNVIPFGSWEPLASLASGRRESGKEPQTHQHRGKFHEQNTNGSDSKINYRQMGSHKIE